MSAPDPNALGDTLKQAADAATPHPVDIDEVLRASRARRRSRRNAVVGGIGAAAVVLVIGGGVMAGLQGLGGRTAVDGPISLESAESGDVASDAADEGAAQDATGPRLVAPEQVNRCGAPVAAPTDAATSPLTVAVVPPEAAVQPGTTNPITVTITNTGADVVAGTIGAAPLTVAEAGIAVWHTGPDSDLPPQPISLATGESASLKGTFETRRCDDADDDGSLRPDLPGLEPGEYGVGAVVSFTGPDGAITYLVSPLSPVRVD
jgi:hypothetical protein